MCKVSFQKRATSVEPPSMKPEPLSFGLHFPQKSASARWRSNPSFRLATEKPIVIKKDAIGRPRDSLNGKLSDSVTSFNETVV